MPQVSDHLMVVDRETQEEVRNVVVLDPIRDRHARVAMLALAASMEPTEPETAFKIKQFISRLDEGDQRQRKAKEDEIPDWLIDQERIRDNGSGSNSSR